MSSDNISRPDFNKAQNKGGGGDDGGYTIQILERLTKVETQISHLASKEDIANLRTSFYKGLLAVIFSAAIIVSRDEIKAFFLSIS